MKRILTIVGCIVVMAASSCTKQYVTPNPNKTVFITVPASSWVLSTDGTAYTVSLDVPELTADDNHYNAVIASIAYPGNDEVYEQLPEVYAGTSYSYTYNAGSVALYAQNADGSLTTANKPVDQITVKLVLVYSN